jgi:hypothetical protein
MTFWLNDYSILFKNEFWPTNSMSYIEKLNAITRVVVSVSLLGFCVTRELKYIWVGLFTLLIIIVYYKSVDTPEAFTGLKTSRTVPTQQNPLMNVLLPEINGNPNRGEALKYNSKTEKKIIDEVKKGLDPRIYRGTNNEMDLEYSMRQFYTNASTTVPNNQEDFSKFCYGDMISAKEGNEVALYRRENSRLGSVG